MKKIGRLKKSEDRTYQHRICLWIALGKEDKQIQRLLQDRLTIDMSVQNINDNYRRAKKWQPIITYLRTRYLRNVSRIPIANQYYRLSLLQEAAVEAIDEKKIALLAQIVREARHETEGEKPLIKTEQHIHYTNMKQFIEDEYKKAVSERNDEAGDYKNVLEKQSG